MSNHEITASDTRKAFLKLWYQERALDLKLRPNSTVPPICGPVKQPWAPADSYNGEVNPGDIRLLPDEWVSDPTKATYVAILQVDKPLGIALVSPFSPYVTPATNTEWLTGIHARALRVLQLWNTQPFPLRAIAQSWLVGPLSGDKLDRAQKLYACCIAGQYPAASDREDIGLGIVDLSDDRCKYQEEEFLNLAPLHASMDRLLEKLECASQPVFDIARRFAHNPQPLMAAAADGDVRCCLLVKGADESGLLRATRTAVIPGGSGEWSVGWNLGAIQKFDGKLSAGMPVYAFTERGAGEHVAGGIVFRSGDDYVTYFEGAEGDGIFEKVSSSNLLLIVETAD